VSTDLAAGAGGPAADGHALPAPRRASLDSALTVSDVVTISIGASNRMYRVETSAGRFILRVPPVHLTSPSAHDMGREFRVLRALDATAVPHPRAVALCEDTAVFGSRFLVMELVDGFNITATSDGPVALSPEQRTAAAYAAVDALADLGNVDWEAAGLAGFGRPAGFLDRQVDRWRGQLESYRVRDLPGLDELSDWLVANRPTGSAAGGPAIMHGDYTFANVMFRPGQPPAVAAIVDWEQSTIGDPLVDLGWFVGLWTHADEVPATTPPGGRWVTQLPGMPTRREVVARYRERSGRDTSAVAFYQALALFKLAVVLEGNYVKFLRKGSRNKHHEEFEWMVPALLSTALAATRGER
jgi:aminoglycoside phosphotransferase (APT) family kinase protein